MDVVSFDAANAASGPAAAAPNAVAGPGTAPAAGPQAPPPRTPDTSGSADTLHNLVNQFFGSGKDSSSHGASKQTISVSFQVATQPNEIVTVFRDSDTNEVIAQFPPEIMVKIAEFFNKLSGATLDQKV